MDSEVWHPNDDLTWFKILFKTFLYKKMNQIGEPLQCLDSKNQLAQEESRAKNLNPASLSWLLRDKMLEVNKSYNS